MSFRHIARIGASLALLGLAAGCDLLLSDPPQIDITPLPRRPLTAPAEVEIEELGRFDIERVNFAVITRDPFTKPVRESYVLGSVAVERECDVEAEPLGMTTPTQLSLMGLITGTAVPRAMFGPIDGSGKAVIVSEGALVGPRCSHRIAEIRDNQVVLIQLSDVEEERTETVLNLTRTRVDAEVVQ